MNNKVGGLTLPDFKTYYKATVIKTMWYLHKRHIYIDQWNREPRNKHMHIRTNDYWQGYQAIHWERTSSIINNARKLVISKQNNEPIPYLIPYTKVNLYLVNDLNVNPKSMKLLEENTEDMVHDTGFGCDFLDRIPKVQATKEKINWTISKDKMNRVKGNR